MSVEQTRSNVSLLLTVLTGCVAVLPGRLHAADDMPDMALLEYLGSWEESDEDWVLLTEEERAASEQTESKRVAEGDATQELDDER